MTTLIPIKTERGWEIGWMEGRMECLNAPVDSPIYPTKEAALEVAAEMDASFFNWKASIQREIPA